ncbi:MAG: hypothetical protein ACT4O1_13350 [Gemmatimonadota bacterium]
MDEPQLSSQTGEPEPLGPCCIDDTDPYPGTDGVYVASFVTLAACTQQYINDSDVDGFDDTCEYRLAEAFAPQLYVHVYDQDLSREPYWALHYLNDVDGNGNPSKLVRVVYLFQYHWDMGNSFDCIDGPASYCSGHPGDNEFAFFDLSYNPETQHWKLERGFLSAHFGTFDGSDSSDMVNDFNLSYAGTLGSYPNIWVARDKHGNYRSWQACNSGGFLGKDDCSTFTSGGRLPVNQYRNVGNDAYRLLNRTVSTQPLIYPGEEHFWNAGEKFCGWVNANRLDCAGVNREVLLFTQDPTGFLRYF